MALVCSAFRLHTPPPRPPPEGGGLAAVLSLPLPAGASAPSLEPLEAAKDIEDELHATFSQEHDPENVCPTPTRAGSGGCRQGGGLRRLGRQALVCGAQPKEPKLIPNQRWTPKKNSLSKKCLKKCLWVRHVRQGHPHLLSNTCPPPIEVAQACWFQRLAGVLGGGGF